MPCPPDGQPPLLPHQRLHGPALPHGGREPPFAAAARPPGGHLRGRGRAPDPARRENPSLRHLRPLDQRAGALLNPSPMPSLPETYYARSVELLARAREANAPEIARLAPLIGQSIALGGGVHTFGSGHSELISREIIGRAGGLVCVTGIIDPTGGFIENLPGYGERLAARYDRQYQLNAGEPVIVISNSGKNASPIDVALYAKAKGLTVAALTCMAMSRAATSQ